MAQSLRTSYESACGSYCATLQRGQHFTHRKAIVVNGRIRSQGRHLIFLEAKDEQGRPVESEGFAPEFDVPLGRSPDYWPYLLNLKVPTSARELNLSLAVTQSRFAEFLAKPEQTASGSAL